MFEGFPYTNFHELNLDWIIKIAKDFLDQYTNIQQTITQGLEDLDTKAAQLQALLDAWYEEHSQDIANQLTAALQDLNDWYTLHQGYLDQYLTDSIAAFGTAADAKAAQTIASIPDDYTSLSNDVSDLLNASRYSPIDISAFLDHNDFTYGGVSFTWNTEKTKCAVAGTATANTGVNLFASQNSLPAYMNAGETYYIRHNSQSGKVLLQIFDYSGGSTLQLLSTATDAFFTLPAGVTGLIIRLHVLSGNTVNETVEPMIFPLSDSEIGKETPIFRGSASSSMTLNDLNDYTENGIYTIEVANMGHAPFTTGNGVLIVTNTRAYVLQTIFFQSGIIVERFYMPFTSTWYDWMRVADTTFLYRGGNLAAVDLDDYQNTGYHFVDRNCENKPIDQYGFLLVIDYSPTKIVVQQFISFTDLKIYLRKYFGNSWTGWVEISGSGGDVYNYNTYNITTSPTITTDDHNWLVAVDTENTSEADATDMTAAIMSMLTDTGYCKLSPGVFYVSGNIDMPAGSCISGCGKDTVIRLLSSVQNGYILKAINSCTIEKLTLSGSKLAPTFMESSTRNGIQFARTVGNTDTVRHCFLSDLFILNFTGSGIYCENTGDGIAENILACNIEIGACKYGINIAYKSEYHKFTNVLTHGCDTACINNGGNNVFTACTFHGNTGFVIDNDLGSLDNPGHGSCVGCTFNHIGGNTGIGLKIINNQVSFIFTGCQFWYGQIDVSRSKGIVFDACAFGGINPAPINLSNNTSVIFSNDVFYRTPTINRSGNTTLVFSNCYVVDTGDPVS